MSLLIQIIITLFVNLPVQTHPTPKNPQIGVTQSNNNNQRNWELSDGIALVQSLKHHHQITYTITSNNLVYQNAYQKAIHNWNRLKIIKLTPVQKNPDITMSDDQTEAPQTTINYGIDKEIQTDYNLKYEFFNQSIIQLHPKFNANNSTRFKHYLVLLAEHEIGHALGFSNDQTVAKNGNKHIMNPDLTNNQIQTVNHPGQYEKTTLLKYYHPQLKAFPK